MRPGAFQARLSFVLDLPKDERGLPVDTQAIAIELTKLVVSQTKPTIGADYFHLATDYLSIYRYILKDLHSHSNGAASGALATESRL